MKEVMIFTDGSSRGNPGPGGWGAVTIYADSHDAIHVDELGGREDMTTNNRMEMKAALEALSHFEGYYENFKNISFTVYTDSAYLLNGITKWVFGWSKNNWMTGEKEEVKNRDIWEKLLQVVTHKNIKWVRIAGHAGIAGNERCDEISTAFADKNEPTLYKGTLAGYQVEEVLNTASSAVSQTKKKKSSSEKAYSYVSMVDGNIETHTTWPACQQRVNGKSKARFKKAVSKEDEKNIISQFKT